MTQPVQNNARTLAQAVATEVARGGRVVSQTPETALVEFGKPVNHVLHLILTLVTLLFWAPVWVVLVVIGMVTRKTVQISVDEYGNVLRTVL